MRIIALFILACTASSIGFAQQNLKVRTCYFGKDGLDIIMPNETSADDASQIFDKLLIPVNKKEKALGFDIQNVDEFKGFFISKSGRTEIYILQEQSFWEPEKLTINSSLANDLYQALDIEPVDGIKSVANLSCTQGSACVITEILCTDVVAPFPAPNAN